MVDVSQQVATRGRSSMQADTRSASCNRVPHGQNITGGVLVPIMDSSAIASPVADRQRHTLLQSTAGAAHVAGREPAVDLDHRLAIHRGFRFNGPNAVTDSGVAEAAGEAVIFNHPPEIQVFDANRVVSGNKIPGQFLRGILPRVGDFLMDSGHALFLSLVAVRALCFARQGLLLAFQLPLVAIRVFRISDTLTGRQRGQTADAKINANSFAGFRQRCWCNVHDQRDKVAARWFSDHRNGTGIDRDMLRPFNLEPPDLGDKQSLVAALEAEPGTGIFRRLLAVFALERRVACAFLEEIAERGLEMAKRLLHRNTGDLVKPDRFGLFLQIGQRCAGLSIIHPFATAVSRCAFGDEPVVHKSGTAKRAGKNLLLLGRRVAAKSPPLFHPCILTDSPVNHNWRL